METILVIPVLLVLLGGVLWLGHIQINRARLLVADRYAAWNLANRHRVPPAGQTDLSTVRANLETPGNSGFEPVYAVLGSAGLTVKPWRFSQTVSCRLSMDLKQMPWVESLLRAQEVMSPANGVPPTGMPNLFGIQSPNPVFLAARRHPELYTNEGGSRFDKPDGHAQDAMKIGWEYLRDGDPNEPWAF